MWSVIVGVKTIVIDFYNLDYSCFNFLTTLVIVNDKDDFIQSLKHIIGSDIDFTHDWNLLSKDFVFDGKTFSRYESLALSA